MTRSLTDFTALSFDCYGTLIDWEAGLLGVLAPWAKRHAIPVSDEDLLVAYSDHEADVEREHPTWLYSEVLAEAFTRTAHSLRSAIDSADKEAIARSVPDWPAFKDSAEALARLKKHYALIILSNVHHEGFAGSQRRLGVEFDRLLLAEDIGSYKPNQRNFDVLLETASQDGHEGRLLHVAQSLFHDHVPAQQRGLHTVWINRRHNQPGWGATPDPGVGVTPNWEFPSLAAFADAVDEAFAQKG